LGIGHWVLEIETWQNKCPMSNNQYPIIKDEGPTDGANAQ